jgi:hypothetical protein
MVCIPAAKGHDDRWITVPQELVRELASLPRLYPRGFARTQDNLRVFGFADRSSPRKGWAKACKLAGIDLLPFHAAGRHGFGQEMNVRQGIDEKAAGEFGGGPTPASCAELIPTPSRRQRKFTKRNCAVCMPPRSGPSSRCSALEPAKGREGRDGRVRDLYGLDAK